MAESIFQRQQKNKVEQFNKLIVGKSKEEIREIEQSLLKPEKLNNPIQNKTVKSDLDDRTVMMIFPDKEAFDLFVKHFPIRTCGGNNLADMEGFMQELKIMEQRAALNKRLEGREIPPENQELNI